MTVRNVEIENITVGKRGWGVFHQRSHDRWSGRGRTGGEGRRDWGGGGEEGRKKRGGSWAWAHGLSHGP